jgi:hypothetical protein
MVHAAAEVSAMATDERDRRIHELECLLEWANRDNRRLERLLDVALAQLKDTNERNVALRQERLDVAHERVVEAEQRLARAVLNAREPDTKLH